MTRVKNQLSPLQRNKKLFGRVCAKITALAPDVKADIYMGKRTTIFRYKGGKPVDVRSEYLILKGLLEHNGIDPGTETDPVELANMLFSRKLQTAD